MTETVIQPVPRTPRWVKIVLVLSLAANLAIAGLIGGVMLRGGPLRLDSQGHIDSVMTLNRALPPRMQRALRDQLRGHRDFFRQGMSEQRAMAHALAQTLRAEPFDPEATARLLTRQRDRVNQLQSLAHDALLDQLRTMTPEQRADYADRLHPDEHD